MSYRLSGNLKDRVPVTVRHYLGTKLLSEESMDNWFRYKTVLKRETQEKEQERDPERPSSFLILFLSPCIPIGSGEEYCLIFMSVSFMKLLIFILVFISSQSLPLPSFLFKGFTFDYPSMHVSKVPVSAVSAVARRGR